LKDRTLAEPLLVGRQQEIFELQRYLEFAFKGRGNTVFISGEAGSGKTRLVKEFLRIARKKGINVLSGWCLSNAAVPYFPFLEALESFSADDERGRNFGSQQLRMKKWLTEPSWVRGSGKQRELSPQNWSDQTFAALTNELLLMSSSKPTVLFIDDIHWADSASLSLLHYIACSISSERILLIATLRSEEIATIPDGQPLPVLDTLRLMGREGIFKEIKLQPLCQEDVGKIAESMLGGAVNAELVERLAVEGRCVPLFVVESIRMLYDQGNLIIEQGKWRLNVDKFGVPDKVKDVFLRRLDSLKSTQRRILEAASVVGERFDPKLVAAVVSQDSLDVLEWLGAISVSIPLVICEGDYCGFVHAKFREMLYDQISAPLKKEYHSRIGEILESLSVNSKQIPVSDLAFHYAQAGNKEKSVKYSLAAGQEALAKWSNKEAIKHFAYIMHTISEDPEYTNERVMALEGLGEAFFSNSMFKEAIKTYEQLSEITTGVVKLRALRRSMDSAFFQGEFAHLLEIVKRAEALVAVDRLEKARVLMNRGRAVWLLGNPDAGREDFEAALNVFKQEYALPDVARTLLGLGSPARGEPKEKGLANSLLAIALYNELGNSRGLMDAYNRAGQCFGFRMLTKEALTMYEKAIKIGEKIGEYNRLAEAYASSSWILENADSAKSLSRSLKALEYCEKTDSDWVLAITYSNLTRQYAKLGDSKHAEEYFERLQKLPPRVLLTYGYVRFGLTKTLFLVLRNRWMETNQYFQTILESPLLVAAVAGFEIETRQNFAWALDKEGRVKEARKQLEAAENMIKELQEDFQHTNIQASMMAPREVEVGKEFTIRIDSINVSRTPCLLKGIEKLVPTGMRVNALPSCCSTQANSIKMQEKQLEPFQVEPIKLTLQATKSGIFSFEPKVVYVDDLGQTRTFEIKPVRVTVQPAASTNKVPCIEEIPPARLEFRSEAAQKAFDYLVSAFVEDYNRMRLPLERSGWRTLLDISKHGKISKYSVYGSANSRGQAVSQLEGLGLAEACVFTGERGRGGNVVKLRVSYENPTVRNHIEARNK
jgi:tetratricopeptide (TPR) repeat protein